MAHIFSLILLVMGLCIPVHAYAAECQGLTTEPTYLDNGVSPRETYRPTESLNLASHGTYDFYGYSNTLTLYSKYKFYGKTSYYVFVTNRSSYEVTVKAKTLLHTYATYTVPADTTISFDIRDMDSTTEFYLTFDGSYMSFTGSIT